MVVGYTNIFRQSNALFKVSKIKKELMRFCNGRSQVISAWSHSFYCFDFDSVSSDVCCLGLALVVSAAFFKYLLMSSVPLLNFSAFTFVTLLGLTFRGLAGFALKM